VELRFLKAVKLRELFEQIPNNLKLYRTGNFKYLIMDPAYYYVTKQKFDEDKLSLIDCNDNNQYEIENCIFMFEAMGDLSPVIAREERLWAYLTHTSLLEYTRKRWPIPENDDKAVQHIRRHFFAHGKRGIERDNSASRLWWMAALCNRVNDLSLEESLACFLYIADVRANIIERPTTSQTVKVFSAVLKKLYESYKSDKELFKRERYRTALKKLNLVGGFKLLEAMDEEDIAIIVNECFHN